LMSIFPTSLTGSGRYRHSARYRSCGLATTFCSNPQPLSNISRRRRLGRCTRKIPIARAKHRAWMEIGSSVLADIWVLETTPDQAVFTPRRGSLAEKFKQIEGAIASGPYFAGMQLSLVDVVFAPAFRYFDTFERFVDLGLFEAAPRVAAWRAALAKRPSVIGAVVPDYSARLEAFLDKKNGWIAHLMRKAGQRRAKPTQDAIGFTRRLCCETQSMA
jgi:Glutathione S-transferase, C-terminal domain